MSHVYYSELWLVTRKDAEKLLDLDRTIQNLNSWKVKEDSLNKILPMYLKYRNLVKRLIVCYDQMVQPQKRDLIKQVLNCAIGRMLEYKREIVKLECSDYTWPDNSLIEMKFTPDDVDIFPRSYYATDRTRELEERRKYINDLISNANKPPEPVIVESRTIEPIMSSVIDVASTASRIRATRSRKLKTIEPSRMQFQFESEEQKKLREAREATSKLWKKAITLIQSHERARSARCIGERARRQYIRNMKLQQGEIELKKPDTNTRKWAAVIIQKAWRRFRARNAMRKRIDRVEELLDMKIGSWKCREAFEKDESNYRRRQNLQPEAVRRMEEKTKQENARVHAIKAAGLMEDITDEIREWFILWYNELGYFDIFPVATAGGSVLVATGQTLTPEEYLLEKLEEAKKKKKSKESQKTKEQDDQNNKLSNKKERSKTNQVKSEESSMSESKAFPGLLEANNDFHCYWKFRDESSNPQQSEYLDLITEKLCYELQLEMRNIVDELMRAELEKLKEALMKDHIDDKVKLDAPTVAKVGKKQKKKEKKDPLGNMAAEDIFIELARNRIIRNQSVVQLKQWIGDLSYQNYEARQELREYRHRLGEVKESVIDYCVLPLLSKETHQIAPLVRSVCIWGLPGHGKGMLADAIFTEVGALVLDLSPETLVNKYLGKKEQDRLMNMVNKVARSYAPSVIFVKGGERPWLKKVPPELRYLQPKRLAPLLTKFVKGIKSGDQILFLTTSSEPYKGGGKFVKIHEKFISIPMTDYNTLYMFYKELLMKYHGIDRNLDVSCLAKVSIGLPLKFIRETIEKIVSIKRRITLKFKPLEQREIMEELLSYDSPGPKVLEQYRKFENLIPLEKERLKMLAYERELREKMNSQKKKEEKKIVSQSK